MSNLGWYQVFTTLAKKFHGPEKMVLAISGVSFAGGIIATKTHDFLKKKRISSPLFTTHTAGKTNEGLVLPVGTQFRVLNSDDSFVMVELISFQNNPYCVSPQLLRSISDFQ